MTESVGSAFGNVRLMDLALEEIETKKRSSSGEGRGGAGGGGGGGDAWRSRGEETSLRPVTKSGGGGGGGGDGGRMGGIMRSPSPRHAKEGFFRAESRVSQGS